MLHRPISDNAVAPDHARQATVGEERRQVRGDKGDVEAADEEPRVEQPIARMAPRPEQRLQQ